MTVENYIETRYRDLDDHINIEYIDLYTSFSDKKLQEIFSTIHSMFVENYKLMNSRLPTEDYTAHYWAENSRKLLLAIDVLRGLERVLKSTDNAFNIVAYYEDIISKSEKFLEQSGGSIIPQGMEKVDIYYTEPIIQKKNSVNLSSTSMEQRYADLKKIGEGSYAIVYTYEDSLYNRKFVLKRARKNLDAKEIERFEQEYTQMNNLSSPYIVDVFWFDKNKNEYVMEFLDFTLYQYYEKYNSKLKDDERKRIVNQIFHAFKYIHSKGLLHRDISPNNILLKVYDDVVVVKVSDFGLVKVLDNTLTSFNTEFKGRFNDPSLRTEGFYNYQIQHETYALTRLIFYVMTGKANTENIKDLKMKAYVEKGLSPNKSERYQSVDEMIIAFNKM